MSKKGKYGEKHFDKWKKLFELRELDNINWEAQKALGYKKLDVPVHHGYDFKYVLRDDISRRDDAHVFQEVLDRFGKSVWCRRKDRTVWNYKLKAYVPVYPVINTLTVKKWEELPQRLQKYFYKQEVLPFYHWRGIVYEYKCNIPNYYFEIQKSKSYKTHYRVVDGVLQSESAEIDQQLEELKMQGISTWVESGRGSLTDFCRIRNKANRRKNKVVCRSYLVGMFEKDKLSFNHRHEAKWYYW